jgi:PadR family transcriptional regulator
LIVADIVSGVSTAPRRIDEVTLVLSILFFVRYCLMTARNAPLPRKEQLILELLAAGGPMYGLLLVERSAGALKRGTVYVTLGRMEAKGLVESEQEPPVPGSIGLPRRIYRLTTLGERTLRAWTVFTRELAWGMKP